MEPSEIVFMTLILKIATTEIGRAKSLESPLSFVVKYYLLLNKGLKTTKYISKQDYKKGWCFFFSFYKTSDPPIEWIHPMKQDEVQMILHSTP